MVELIVGAAIGAGGMLLKDKMSSEQSDMAINKLKSEINSLSDENEKLRRRYKDMERQVEDLLAESEKLRRQSKTTDEDKDDMEDELDDAKAKVKKLTTQNEELQRKIAEYQSLCQSYENEIATLKK